MFVLIVKELLVVFVNFGVYVLEKNVIYGLGLYLLFFMIGKWVYKICLFEEMEMEMVILIEKWLCGILEKIC